MRFLLFTAISTFLACSADKGVVTFNREPTTAILEPLEMQQFEEESTIQFWGQVSDDGDLQDLTIEWASSIDGLFPETDTPDADGYVNYTTANLSQGTHVITLRATDSQAAQGESTVTIDVMDIPEAPSIIVMHPTMNEKGLENMPFVFMANVSDRQDLPSELFVEVSSDIGGAMCFMTIDGAGNAQCAWSLPLGDYLLTFKVTDTDGNTAEALANFKVVTEGDFDGDNDGYSPNGGDCNDSNVTIYPGAPEICDGLDNDCNNLTGIDVATDCYDDDGDNYCESPPCINASGTLPDCDDTNPSIGPGDTEIVNGLDDDCNGIIDDGTNVYDDDGDGFCESPPCVNTNNMESDCDDENYNVYPGADEICGDGLDNDCDGSENARDAIGCMPFYYDQDGDGYGIMGATECWCDDGQFPYTGINTTDCLDSNPDVYPGQMEYFNTHRGDGSFDYDCDFAEEKLYTGVGGCSFSQNLFAECDLNPQGWAGTEPPCGQSGSWIGSCDKDFPWLCTVLFAGVAWATNNWNTVLGILQQCGASCDPEYENRDQLCR